MLLRKLLYSSSNEILLWCSCWFLIYARTALMSFGLTDSAKYSPPHSKWFDNNPEPFIQCEDSPLINCIWFPMFRSERKCMRVCMWSVWPLIVSINIPFFFAFCLIWSQSCFLIVSEITGLRSLVPHTACTAMLTWDITNKLRNEELAATSAIEVSRQWVKRHYVIVFLTAFTEYLTTYLKRGLKPNHPARNTPPWRVGL